MAEGIAPRIPPQNIEAERSALGAVLIDQNTFVELTAKLGAADFFLPQHREVFEAMVALNGRGRVIEIVSLGDELRLRGSRLSQSGGDMFLIELAQATPSAVHVEHYVDIIRSKAKLRRFISLAGDHLNRAYGEEGGDADAFLDAAEAELFTLSMERNRPSSVTVAALIPGLIDQIEERARTRRDVIGVPSGFTRLDRYTAGFMPEHLTVVAARPGAGKTALALNVAQHAAIQCGLPVLIFSLEMTHSELAERFLASEGEISSRKLRLGHVTQADFRDKIFPAGKAFQKVDITIDDVAAQSIDQIVGKSRKWRADRSRFPTPADGQERPLGLIIVDYLQLAKGSGRGKGDSREQEVSEISRGLKELAKTVKLPVIAVAQLNRDSVKRADKRPVLSDLRESGAIEQDADEIIFIHRESSSSDDGPAATRTDNVAELILAKNRHGPTGDVLVKWRPEFSRFENYADDPAGGSDAFDR